jgi:sugar O-acyltransferase (sialic acid O-acetyltransferase NeuD family)
VPAGRVADEESAGDMSLPIAILGAGGHGRVVASICRAAGREVQCFVDSALRGRSVAGIDVVGGDEMLDDPAFVRSHAFVVAIGDQCIRRRVAKRVAEKGGRLTTVIHPSAVVADDVQLGCGVVLGPAAVINCGTSVGDLVIINTGATIDHDSILEEAVHIGPGANLGGNVSCGEAALVGLGAAVLSGKRIGARAIVGAGAVVTRDVPPDVTVVGCPARVIESSFR